MSPGKMIFAVLELLMSPFSEFQTDKFLTFIFAVLLEYHFR